MHENQCLRSKRRISSHAKPPKFDCHSGIDQQSDANLKSERSKKAEPRRSRARSRAQDLTNGTEIKAHGKATRQTAEEDKGT